jgi:hypothetical protein
MTELTTLRRSSAASRTRSSLGGALGNHRLTALTGLVLLLGLAVEGATIPFLGSLLSVHIFVGMLLLGPVALKLASAGYRVARYYTGGREYVRLGPPAPLMRVLVAPVLVLSTLTLFGTGILLLAVPHRGTALMLHKASFIVWFGAMTIHVLAYALRAARGVVADLMDALPRGRWLRIALTVLAIVVGVLVAVETYPLAHPWLNHQHWSGGDG